VIYPALRHRVLLNFEAEAEQLETDEILRVVIDEVSED